jgi:sn-glycerol 3-phosphate transport system permease protein
MALQMKTISSRGWRTAWWMLAPTLIFLLLFTYGPAIYNVIQSGPGYRSLWTDRSNLASLQTTVVYVLIAMPGSIVLGLASAILVDGRTPSRVFARAVLFHPVILPAIAFAAIWLYLLNPNSSPLSGVWAFFNGGNPNILGSASAALVAVAIIGILKQFGLYMLYFLAGLQAIPKELLEAAAIDGASRWQRFWRVTIPQLTPTLFFVGTVAVLDALRNVDHIFTLTRGWPAEATNILLYRIFVLGFDYYNNAQAGALTTVLIVVLTIIALVAMPRIERGVHYAS